MKMIVSKNCESTRSNNKRVRKRDCWAITDIFNLAFLDLPM